MLVCGAFPCNAGWCECELCGRWRVCGVYGGRVCGARVRVFGACVYVRFCMLGHVCLLALVCVMGV